MLRVKDLMTIQPYTLLADASLREALNRMRVEELRQIPVIDPQDNLIGIITDRDLCTRVLAEGLSPQDDVSSVMTTEVMSLDHNAYIYEAMLTMLRYNVHHLPVVKNQCI